MTYSRDFSEDEFKALSRLYNIEQVSRCSHLVDRAGKLLVDWAEMPGSRAPTYQLLLDRGMLGPGRFMGPEMRDEVFQALCEEFGEKSPDHEFFNIVAETWVRGKRAMNVGAFNWDTEHLANGVEFRDNLEAMVTFGKRQEQRLGNFALIVNAGIDRGATLEDFRSALAEVGHEMSDAHLKKPGVLYGGPGRSRTSYRINYCIIFGPVKPNQPKERR